MKDTPCAQCLNVLGTASRMKIYNFLKTNKKCSVSAIVKVVNLKQPTVSYHLNEMKKVGLVKSTKEGKYVFYSLNSKCPYQNEECVLNIVKFLDNQNA